MENRIENCSFEDFNQIREDIIDFWGSERTLHLHQPFLVYEFGDTSFVIKENSKVIAYMFAFFSQKENLVYVHLLGVRNDYQHKGLGSILYNNIINIAKHKGFTKIKAITTPANQTSINFHKKIGMTLLGEINKDGINVIKNYSGPNQDRVVFEKQI